MSFWFGAPGHLGIYLILEIDLGPTENYVQKLLFFFLVTEKNNLRFLHSQCHVLCNFNVFLMNQKCQKLFVVKCKVSFHLRSNIKTG